MSFWGWLWGTDTDDDNKGGGTTGTGTTAPPKPREPFGPPPPTDLPAPGGSGTVSPPAQPQPPVEEPDPTPPNEDLGTVPDDPPVEEPDPAEPTPTPTPTPTPQPEPPQDDGPNPVLFRNSSSGYRDPDNMLVSVIQAALKHHGLYDKSVDGEYGPGTEAAVRAFQQRSGATADGQCRDNDWVAITGIPAPSAFDRCIHLTSAFEGHGFDLAVGNFDNAYLTWGIIGYTLKHDLPGFIKKVDENAPGRVREAFGSYEAKFRSILKASNSAKARWGNSISTGNNRYHIKSDWREKFAKLGSFPEVQELQIQDAQDRYWKIAIRDAKLYGAKDLIDMAIFFDTAVQNGGCGRASIKGPMEAYTRQNPNASGEERRLRWARIIADGSKAFARKDVYSRRSTIAKGEGRVHGANFRLADWGLTPVPVDVNTLEFVHATFMPMSFTGLPPVTDPTPTPDPVPTPDPTPQPDPTPGPGTGPGPIATPSGVPDFKDNLRECIAAALVHIDRTDLSKQKWGAIPAAPVQAILTAAVAKQPAGAEIPSGWEGWPMERQCIALIQAAAHRNKINAGEIDGYWGPMTDTAYSDLAYLRDNGKLPEHNWRKGPPSIINVNPHNWPRQDHRSLTNFYGPPCRIARKSVRVPWTMRLSWDKSAVVNSISCHAKVADSLAQVFEKVYEHYGEEELQRLGLDLYAGCYNCRKKRGGSSYSTHAWAIAIDFDPDRNKLRWGHDRAQMARPEYYDWWEIWEKEGWVSLGRSANFDYMHVQAAKLR